MGERVDLTLFAGDVVDLIDKGGTAMREAVRLVWIDGRTIHRA